MKGKYLLLRLSPLIFLAGCATAPPPERSSILDAMAESTMSQPQSCAARDGATVCVQSMRLNRVKDCTCVDRRQFMNGHLGAP